MPPTLTKESSTTLPKVLTVVPLDGTNELETGFISAKSKLRFDSNPFIFKSISFSEFAKFALEKSISDAAFFSNSAFSVTFP